MQRISFGSIERTKQDCSLQSDQGDTMQIQLPFCFSCVDVSADTRYSSAEEAMI